MEAQAVGPHPAFQRIAGTQLNVKARLGQVVCSIGYSTELLCFRLKDKENFEEENPGSD